VSRSKLSADLRGLLNEGDDMFEGRAGGRRRLSEAYGWEWALVAALYHVLRASVCGFAIESLTIEV
jgi:hypothetical protein